MPIVIGSSESPPSRPTAESLGLSCWQPVTSSTAAAAAATSLAAVATRRAPPAGVTGRPKDAVRRTDMRAPGGCGDRLVAIDCDSRHHRSVAGVCQGGERTFSQGRPQSIAVRLRSVTADRPEPAGHPRGCCGLTALVQHAGPVRHVADAARHRRRPRGAARPGGHGRGRLLPGVRRHAAGLGPPVGPPRAGAHPAAHPGGRRGGHRGVRAGRDGARPRASPGAGRLVLQRGHPGDPGLRRRHRRRRPGASATSPT